MAATDASRLARRVSAREFRIERMAMKLGRWLAVTAVAGAYFAAFAASAQLLKQGDDALRPLYAQASDIAEGKDLATSSCAKCHGGDGIATDKLTPNLAGQRPAYLYLELKAYQAGARTNVDMTEKVKFLSDDAIVKLAATTPASIRRSRRRQPRLNSTILSPPVRRRQRPAPSVTATTASAIRRAFPI